MDKYFLYIVLCFVIYCISLCSNEINKKLIITLLFLTKLYSINMDFKDYIKNLAERTQKLKDSVKTEEATKNALIMPFIQILGYDVFNPLEVVPEFVADIGTKKGEKVDYAIFKEESPVMIIECKHWTDKLEVHDTQLMRYFNVTKAKFGILTNGIVYKFYTDLDEPNKMDELPFLEFNLLEPKENLIEDLKRFHKSYFDIPSIVSAASELKYTTSLKNILQREFNAPSTELVRFFAKQVYQGPVTEKVLNQFAVFMKKSLSHWLTDSLNEKLKTALSSNQDVIIDKSFEVKSESIAAEPAEIENKVITTDLEKEAFFVVKSILRTAVAPEMITYKDFQSQFNITYNDKASKTICKLYLNNPNKMFLGIFDEMKKEIKQPLSSIDDIYNYSEALLNTAKLYSSLS